MTDRLCMGYINSLPQPFVVRFYGSHDWWEVHDIDVETGLMRFNVCGLLDVKHFAEVAQIKSVDGDEHDPESYWLDMEDTQ